MSLYVATLKVPHTPNSIRVHKGFSQFVAYKTNTQNSSACLYTSDEQSKKEIPFSIATRGIIYAGVNLNMEAKGLYIEKY